uniref:Putative membrane protein n=1 Tax=Ixodes ricinus TaxID=34613 RepID=V5H7J4_IXORI
MNPMVLMMVVPLLVIMVLLKLMNAADPETQREMNQMQMPKYDMPELSEMMTSLFTGGNQETTGRQDGPGSKRSVNNPGKTVMHLRCRATMDTLGISASPAVTVVFVVFALRARADVLTSVVAEPVVFILDCC